LAVVVELVDIDGVGWAETYPSDLSQR
jgi:hypothetical protein